MIKINLLAEKKQARAKAKKPARVRVEGGGRGSTFLLAGILALGAICAGAWWFMLSGQVTDLRARNAEADSELERLAEVRKKGDEYKRQKELLARKIDLITELKKQQAVPVQILDQISKNLPDFLWLESMSAKTNSISISGKATTYNAVSNFYGNLTGSGYFGEVSLGRVFEVPEGVSFSLTCRFVSPGSETGSSPGQG